MYATLIGAGISALSDLYSSATSSAGKGNTSFQLPSDETSDPVAATAGSGGSLSDTVQQMLGGQDATKTVAHHHGGHHAAYAKNQTLTAAPSTATSLTA